MYLFSAPVSQILLAFYLGTKSYKTRIALTLIWHLHTQKRLIWVNRFSQLFQTIHSQWSTKSISNNLNCRKVPCKRQSCLWRFKLKVWSLKKICTKHFTSLKLLFSQSEWKEISRLLKEGIYIFLANSFQVYFNRKYG